jgi:hypothetical protein
MSARVTTLIAGGDSLKLSLMREAVTVTESSSMLGSGQAPTIARMKKKAAE